MSHISRGTFLAIVATSIAAAQSPASISATSNVDRLAALTTRSPIRLSLSHPLADGQGELALVVGGVDVTAVAERTDSTILYRPNAVPLPEGDAEVVLYRRAGTRWTEIRRMSVRVAQAVVGAGAFSQSATLGNKGQVAEGRSAGVPAPDRRTFQDFVLNAGLRSTGESRGWTLSTQSNYVGVSRRQEALGFAARGNGAPLLDLSDYSIGLRSASTALSLGSVTFGTSRQLANGFAARGGTLNVTPAGGSTSFTLGAMSGSPQTGWSDFSGLERPTDRVFGAALGQELVAAHPGSLRVEMTVLDGSKQPRTSFTQGAVVDAERSAGGSVQLTAALPNQRARVTSGYTRSRFENPAADPQLLGDTAVKRPQPATRGARFVEGSAVVLQNVATPLGGPASLTLGFRDERVDPLFRSVAAQTAADHQQDGADATVSLGAISGQVSQNWTRDNLGRVQSVLTTRGNATTASLVIPVAAVGGTRLQKFAALLPMLSFTFNETRQAADGTPVNGAFRPTDLPDQVNSIGDATATWQAGTTRLALHVNAANQDNRQPTRENADFDSGVLGLSIGRALGTRGEVSLDLGNEYQTARERDETTRTKRVTVNASFRPRATLNALAAFSVTDVEAPAGATSVNTEQHLEFSQGFNLWSAPAGEPQRGQLFVRFARAGSLAPSVAATGVVAPAALGRAQWTVATGLNLRLF